MRPASPMDRLDAPGVGLDWLTFAEDYGKRPGFIAGLDQRDRRFVGEAPRSWSCLAANRCGRPPDPSVRGRRAEEVVGSALVFRDQPWRVLRLTRQTQPDQVWRVKAAR